MIVKRIPDITFRGVHRKNYQTAGQAAQEFQDDYVQGNIPDRDNKKIYTSVGGENVVQYLVKSTSKGNIVVEELRP